MDIFLYMLYTIARGRLYMSNNVVTSDSAAGRGPAQNTKFSRDQKAGKNKKSIPVKRVNRTQKKG